MSERSRKLFLGFFPRPSSHTSLSETLGISQASSSRPLYAKNIIQALNATTSPTKRIQVVEELCEIVKKYPIVDIDAVWSALASMLSPESPANARQICFKFIVACHQGNANELNSVTRAVFYRDIRKNFSWDDFEDRFAALRELTRNGRDVSGFEKNIPKLLCDWLAAALRLDSERKSLTGTTTSMPPVSDSNTIPYLQPIVKLIANIVKFNAACCEDTDMKALIDGVAEACLRTKNDHDRTVCLEFAEIVMPFGFVPVPAMTSFVRMLCHLSSFEHFTKQSWAVMKNLLKNHGGLNAIRCLCKTIECDPTEVPDTLARTAVMLLTQVSSDAYQVSELYFSLNTLLISLRYATKYRRLQVDAQILKSINLLIEQHEGKLKLIDWEIIYDIAENVLHYLFDADKSGRNLAPTPANVVLNTSDELLEESDPWLVFLHGLARLIHHVQFMHTLSTYDGPYDRFMQLVHKLRRYLSEGSVLSLLEHYQHEQLIYPVEVNWLQTLTEAVQAFFIDERTRFSVRSRIFSLMVDVYEVSKDVFEDELTEVVLLPVLSCLTTEKDPEIASKAVDFLVDVCCGCNDVWFPKLLDILLQCIHCKCVVSPMPHSHVQRSSSGPSSPSIPRRFSYSTLISHSSMYPKNSLCHSLTASTGFIRLFESCLYSPKIERGMQLFTTLIKLIESPLAHQSSRLALLDAAMAIRVDINHRLYLARHPDEGILPDSLLDRFGPGTSSSVPVSPRGADGISRTSSTGSKPERGAVSTQQLSTTLERTTSLRENPSHTLSPDFQGATITSTRSPPPSIRTTGLERHHSARSVSSGGTISWKAGNMIEEDAPESPAIEQWVAWRSNRCSLVMSRASPYFVSYEPAAAPLSSQAPNSKTLLGEVEPPSEVDGKGDGNVGEGDHEGQAGDKLEASPKSIPKAVLPIGLYLEALIKRLSDERSWVVYVYILYHLPVQLSNKHLFCGAIESVLKLRAAFYNWIRNDRVTEGIVDLPLTIKKDELHVVAYQTLTTLISYRRHFSKSHKLELVHAFQEGLQKRPLAAKPCIHALMICCVELPMSMATQLPATLTKLAQIITSAKISVHILEFLSALARLPRLYANLTEADFRRIFAIAIQYIQDSHAIAAAYTSSAHTTPSPSATPSISSPSGNSRSTGGSLGQPRSVGASALVEYEMVMAYHVISIWFMSLRQSERRKYVPFIVRGLLNAGEISKRVDDYTQACFDMLQRYTYANYAPRPEKNPVTQLLLAESSKSDVISRTWVKDQAVITIRTARTLGWAEVTVRRASGASTFLLKVGNPQRSTTTEFKTLPALLMLHRNPKKFNKPGLVSSADAREKGSLESSDGTGAGAKDENVDGQSSSEAGSGPNSDGKTEEADESVKVRSGADEASSRTRLEHLFSSISHQTIGSRPRAYSGSIADVLHTRSQPQGSSTLKPEGARVVSAASSPVRRSSYGDRVRQGREPCEEDDTNEEELDGFMAAILSDPDPELSDKASTLFRKDDSALDPGYLFLQLSTHPELSVNTDIPRPLPDDETTQRLLNSLDRASVVDFHKIGVLYVGPGQTDEVDILANVHGSPEYVRFLDSLGELISLREWRGRNTGGLNYERDGEYTYYWYDDITEIIFHVATLMPTNLEADPICLQKKLHIGNNCVRIVYNDSGTEFRLDTIPSEFNLINVVISPHSTDGSQRHHLGTERMDTGANTFFKVQVQRRPDMPEIGPASDFKMVSGDALAAFVRQVALHASIFSQVFLEQAGLGDYSVNWRSRVREIKRMRERAIAATQAAANAAREQRSLTPGPGEDANSVLRFEPLVDFTKFADNAPTAPRH
ncbi:uncharacterized protein VTP21DRAFT_5097 [Calcarisporiella thermophila]|uniref:uncharacterized protein n=1 Tax=Calcarisporiella thermophila TaxID=911321 RepID=UPI0037428BB1